MNAPDSQEVKPVEDLSDDKKKQAIEAARGVKDAAQAKTLEGISETSDEQQTRSPKSPGYDEHSGKAMKPAAEWPGDDSSSVPSIDEKPSAFEEALKALQQKEPKESKDPDKGIDI